MPLSKKYPAEPSLSVLLRGANPGDVFYTHRSPSNVTSQVSRIPGVEVETSLCKLVHGDDLHGMTRVLIKKTGQPARWRPPVPDKPTKKS